jgi:hypothetical protein
MAREALADDHPFVRNSVVSSLRGLAIDRLPTAAAFDDMVGLFQSSLRGRGPRRPVDLLYVVLHVLVLLDPSRALPICTALVADSDGPPTLRGHAIFWLGELWREMHPEWPPHVLQDRLLATLAPHREYAMNVAQALLAPLPRADQARSPEALGIDTRYAGPLWRTSWN